MGELEDDSSSVLHEVQEYRKIVLMYEATDAEIDKLIMAHGGSSDKMSPDDLARYRHLARQRDELLNEMRLLERRLLSDESGDSW